MNSAALKGVRVPQSPRRADLDWLGIGIRLTCHIAETGATRFLTESGRLHSANETEKLEAPRTHDEQRRAGGTTGGI